MEIWKEANIKSTGKWYIITNDFMMATLKRADIESGYFMVDSSTWAVGKGDITHLKVLFKGDPILINVYHALCLPDGETDGQLYASKFIDFVSSEAGQKIIREYGKDLYGEPMYNDANYAIQYDH
jgi:tungstate transport system substrate-binding protein